MVYALLRIIHVDRSGKLVNEQSRLTHDMDESESIRTTEKA